MSNYKVVNALERMTPGKPHLVVLDTVFPTLAKAISFVTAGTLIVEDSDGNVVTIPDGALVAGIMHPIEARKILAGSTAVGIVAYL